MSKDFFNALNGPKERPKTGRIIFAMDATGSRSHAWEAVSRIHRDMFSAIDTLGELEIKLIYFRGASECRASPWLKDQPTLLRLLGKVACEPGETQIERVLNHVSAENDKSPVHAVIFIGDSCEEPFSGIETKSEILGAKKVPLFVFHDTSGKGNLLYGRNPETEKLFRHMAKSSNGAYMMLDTSSSKILSNVLQAVAIFATGGRRALEDYSKKKGVDESVLKLTAQLR